MSSTDHFEPDSETELFVVVHPSNDELLNVDVGTARSSKLFCVAATLLERPYGLCCDNNTATKSWVWSVETESLLCGTAAGLCDSVSFVSTATKQGVVTVPSDPFHPDVWPNLWKTTNCALAEGEFSPITELPGEWHDAVFSAFCAHHWVPREWESGDVSNPDDLAARFRFAASRVGGNAPMAEAFREYATLLTGTASQMRSTTNDHPDDPKTAK